MDGWHAEYSNPINNNNIIVSDQMAKVSGPLLASNGCAGPRY
jgi:hypothetical protein